MLSRLRVDGVAAAPSRDAPKTPLPPRESHDAEGKHKTPHDRDNAGTNRVTSPPSHPRPGRPTRRATAQPWTPPSSPPICQHTSPRPGRARGRRRNRPQNRQQRRPTRLPVWKSKFYGAFVLNRRVVLHAIDATPARWRGDAGSSPLDGTSAAASSPRNDLVKNCRCAPVALVDFHTGAFRGSYLRAHARTDIRAHAPAL